MSVVANSLRSTQITVAVATVGPFLVGFPIRSTQALRVFVDGVEATSGWTVSATFVAGQSTDASITFSVALAAGAKLQIDDWEGFGRDTEYLNGDPGLATKIQSELSDLAAAVLGLKREADRSFRSLTDAQPALADLGDGVLEMSGGKLRRGPTGSAISAANAAAVAAEAAKNSALSSLALIQAAMISLINWWRGAWVTATAYAVSDIVTTGGSTYICAIAHTSAGSFATDLGAGRWYLVASKGDPGAGSGDVIAANQGSEYSAVASNFLNNLGFSSYFRGLRTAADQTALYTAIGLTAALEAKQAASANLTTLAGLVSGGNAEKAVRVNAAGSAYESFDRSQWSTPTIVTSSGTGLYTSQDLFDGANIPTDWDEVILDFAEVSFAAVRNLLVQVSDATPAWVASGYEAFSGDGSSNIVSTAGFIVKLSDAATVYCGRMTLQKLPNGDITEDHHFSNMSNVRILGTGRHLQPNQGGIVSTVIRWGADVLPSAAFDRVRMSIKWSRP